MRNEVKNNKKRKPIKRLLLFLTIILSLLCLLPLVRPSLVVPLFGGRRQADKPNVKWVVRYPVLGDYFNEWIFDRGCKEIGGTTYYSYGVMGRIEGISCLLPFSDAGKSCNSSVSCSGFCQLAEELPDSCIYDDSSWGSYLCEENVYGVCSSFPSYSFDSYLEVNGKKIVRMITPRIL